MSSLVVGIGACFLLLLLLHTGFISHVSAIDTLAPGEFLSEEDSLESSSTQYRLKFIERSSSTWYLCIQLAWYYFEATPEYITIWDAAWQTQWDFPPELYMSEEGQLIIHPSEDFIVNSQQPSYIKNTRATLLDNGNLVLRSPGGRTLWQSFDHPTNTWVQGMKLGWFGLKTPRPHQRFLTSWTNQQNPSPGAFTFGVHPNNAKELVLMRRGIVYWQSGVWNGTNFPFLPDIFVLNFSYFSDENKSYFVLNQEFHFNSTYILIHAIGGITVEKYGYTGSISAPINCYNSETTYYEDGCVRVKKSSCTSVGDWFNSTTGFIDEWDQYLSNSTFGITDCDEICAKNCSCTAYASINSEAGTGCKFSSSTAYHYGSEGEALYIRHNAKAAAANRTKLSPLHHPAPADFTTRKSHHNKTPTIAALIPLAFLVTLAMIFIVCYIKNPRKCCRTCFFIAPTEHSRQQLAGKEDEELPFFNFKSLEMDTNCFSDENKLGQGGFGPVYKHRNLVRLLGCCTHGDERILIYEYLPNKSLDSILFDERKKICLDWMKRVSIIDGIAQGLLYLHKYSRMRIIHRDLKTSNILLDIHMHPKISDFGTARIFKDNVYQANTKSIIGTYGYMSPEYAMNGCFSEKSNVFSFGIMVIEIVSGKRNNDFYNPSHVSNLLGYAWDVWMEGRISDLIDPTMDKTVSINEATRCIQVGLLCVQDSAADRPTMSDVVSMLGNESIVLPTPKQPGFSTVIGLKCDDVGNNPNIGSVNMVTISDIEGR